ncbi:MAG: DUF2797 domain-containing protein [Halobacteriovoraceae bacterium]|nr:DUF2797 domain-containing protein [Halobacteriovoraceae bacterium]MCB9094056.1 DUF2797 domain-containing protein [Halobacteriovoraceae bacterium]
MKGSILKMKGKLGEKGEVEYRLPVGEELVSLNPFIGKEMKLEFTGNIYCIDTGKKINKSYNNGYSYESFVKLAACDVCIVQPEKCHYHKGTCREPLWGERECMQPHFVYLAITSGVKIGITRESQIPTRWIDQGACYALPILKVKNRLASGLIEEAIKTEVNDKTQWRKMLEGTPEREDLKEFRDTLYKKHKKEIVEMRAETLEEEVVEIHFPVEEYPQKIKSLSFDKTPVVEGKLLGIKGQYLIFENSVLNIRKHQGYEINFSN